MDINLSDSKKISIGLDSFNSLFRKYKSFLLPVFVIVACILILFLIILPQFQNFLSARQQLEAETQKLNTLKNNYNFLSGLDDKENSDNFKTLSFALPPNKDFTGILNAISISSSKTGVGIGDFSFSLGDLSKVSDEGIISNPSIKIDINLTGNAKSITNFINELYRTAPVSEVVSAKTNLQTSNLVILFYYKPYPPQNVSDEAPVVPISSQNLSLIKQINSWNNTTNQGIFGLIPISTSSAPLSSSSASNPSPF